MASLLSSSRVVSLPEEFKFLTRFWNYLQSGYPSDLDRLSSLRGYDSDHPFFNDSFLELAYVPETSPELADFLCTVPRHLGLSSGNSPREFLLAGRWVTPCRLPSGEVAALIGWMPGVSNKMKYLTTPTRGFSKKHLLLGTHRLPDVGSASFCLVVEGVFDYLALTSLGIPAVSVMGRTCSPYHRAQFPLLGGRVIGVPDRDAFDVIARDKWGCQSYLSWSGAIPAKDMDDLVRVCPDLGTILQPLDKVPDTHIRLQLD